MILAIEHFNRDHTRPLTMWGPEHSYMHTLLGALPEADSQLVGAYRIGLLDYDLFRTLTVEFWLPDEDNARLAGESARARQLFDSLVARCPYTRLTRITEYNGPRLVNTGREVETTYHFDYDDPRQPCAHPGTRTLRDSGLTFGRVREWYDDERLERFQLLLGTDYVTMRDMWYVKEVLLRHPRLRPLVGFLSPPDTGPVYPRAADIRLVGSTGEAAFADAVRLRIWRGWGDCPSGCTASHEWVVEAVPIPVDPHAHPLDRYRFRVRIVSHQGAPLPSRR